MEGKAPSQGAECPQAGRRGPQLRAEPVSCGWTVAVSGQDRKVTGTVAGGHTASLAA